MLFYTNEIFEIVVLPDDQLLTYWLVLLKPDWLSRLHLDWS
jgi:hypothetical protein